MRLVLRSGSSKPQSSSFSLKHTSIPGNNVFFQLTTRDEYTQQEDHRTISTVHITRQEGDGVYSRLRAGGAHDGKTSVFHSFNAVQVVASTTTLEKFEMAPHTEDKSDVIVAILKQH
jgi:hypothetical protein